MAGQDVSCMLIRSCSFLLYDEESKSFLVYADKIAARGCDVHADGMYGPEKCRFPFLRSRPFMVTLVLHTMYNLAWWKEWLSFFLQKKQNPGGSSLPCDDIAHGHIPSSVGCLGVKLILPLPQLCPVGAWAGWLAGQGPCYLGKTCLPGSPRV